MLSQYSFLHITSNLPVVSSAPGSWSFYHRQCHGTRCFSVSLSSLYYCKALALDRGACHPHTVIIPELTSPLSIELLRRWRGHRIPCSERQHCPRPSGLGLQKKEKSKMDAVALKQTARRRYCWVLVVSVTWKVITQDPSVSKKYIRIVKLSCTHFESPKWLRPKKIKKSNRLRNVDRGFNYAQKLLCMYATLAGQSASFCRTCFYTPLATWNFRSISDFWISGQEKYWAPLKTAPQQPKHNKYQPRWNRMGIPVLLGLIIQMSVQPTSAVWLPTDWCFHYTGNPAALLSKRSLRLCRVCSSWHL